MPDRYCSISVSNAVISVDVGKVRLADEQCRSLSSRHLYGRGLLLEDYDAHEGDPSNIGLERVNESIGYSDGSSILNEAIFTEPPSASVA